MAADAVVRPRAAGEPGRRAAAAGRTVLVGDVHGCARELEALLAEVRYAPGRDALVLVGDLVARGPDSRGTIERARACDARAVRGNHDEKLLAWWRVADKHGRRRADREAALGGKHREVARTLEREHFEWLDALPLVLDLRAAHGAIVVHAGLDPGVALEAQKPNILMNVRSIDAAGEATSKLEGTPWARAWGGPAHVVFGHDARRGLQLEPHATGLDTGCCYGRELTALVLAAGEPVPRDGAQRRARLASVPALATYCPSAADTTSRTTQTRTTGRSSARGHERRARTDAMSTTSSDNGPTTTSSPQTTPSAADDPAGAPGNERRGRTPGAIAATTFLVIRHAESAANAGGYFGSQNDSPLTAVGEEQARALGEALASASIDAVYSSDLSRASRTVEPIARARGLTVQTTALLRERHMGEMTGLSFAEAKARYEAVWARLVARDPHAVPPGGESHAQLGERVRPFLAEVTRRHRGQTVVLGSHGGTIHHIVRQLLGVHDLSTYAFWLAVDNASVTRIDLTEPASGVVAPRLAYANRVIRPAGEPTLP